MLKNKHNSHAIILLNPMKNMATGHLPLLHTMVAEPQ